MRRYEVGAKFRKLKRLAGAAHEIAEHGDVGTVGTDAASIDRKAEAFGKIEIDTRVIKFRETKTCGRRDAVRAGRIDRPRGAMAVPRAARQFVELLPVAFVPSIHGVTHFAR